MQFLKHLGLRLTLVDASELFLKSIEKRGFARKETQDYRQNLHSGVRRTAG